MQTDSPRFSGKIKIFVSKVMNTLDMIFIVIMIIALVFRLSPFEGHLMMARLLYCINTIYWIIKLMEFLLINKYTGPLIIIASRMVSYKRFCIKFLGIILTLYQFNLYAIWFLADRLVQFCGHLAHSFDVLWPFETSYQVPEWGLQMGLGQEHLLRALFHVVWWSLCRHYRS